MTKSKQLPARNGQMINVFRFVVKVPNEFTTLYKYDGFQRVLSKNPL
jgi:hypothetical protein